MVASLTQLEFRLADEIQGQPLTPATVDLPTLRGFLEEVEKLIKGDVPGASLADSRVKIEPGSVKLLAFVASSLAASVTEDLTRLRETGDLDKVQPKRAEVISVWQTRVQKYPNRSYFVSGAEPSTPPVQITRETQFEHRGENAWVAVEKYVTGKVIDMGGRQSPNVHLVLAGTNQPLKVSASEQQLAGEPHLYREVTLRVTAEQHLGTGALRNARMIEFLPTSQEVDEAVLVRLWEKGRVAWQNVADAQEWVEEIRGH